MPSTTQSNPTSRKQTLIRHGSHFSRTQLASFAIVFGVIGGFILYRTFAASPLVASIEAEQMSLPAGAAAYSDSKASAGRATVLSYNGTLSGSVNFPSPVTSYSILAKGSQCRGAPNMVVKLDGTTVLSTGVGATSWNAYTITPGSVVASGTHLISIAFTNDYYRSRCDRNLFIDVSNFYGQAAPPPSVPTVTISASPNTLTAGQASTLTWNSTGATSCTASGSWSGSQQTSGSVSTGALNQSSTYNLACTGAGGSSTARADITVNPLVSSCSSSTTAWQNASFANQTGIFSVIFSATPSVQGMDGVTGFSDGAVSDYTTAASVRFSSGNAIEALNGSAYASVNPVAYEAGKSYTFRLVINVPAHTFDAFVAPAGGSEVQIAKSYAFRSSQAAVTQLNNWTIIAATSVGTHQVCNMTVNGSSAPAPSSAPPPNASVSCTKYASPSGSDSGSGSLSSPYLTPQKLVDNLSAGQTGCLRGGTYPVTFSGRGDGYGLGFKHGGSAGAPITLTSYPGEKATISTTTTYYGMIIIPAGSDYITLTNLKLSSPAPYTEVIRVNGSNVTISDSELTSNYTGTSCMLLGGTGPGETIANINITRNVIHDCGMAVNDNKDHCIYAAHISSGSITHNILYNCYAYVIQLYPDAHNVVFDHNTSDGGVSTVRGGLLFGGESAPVSSDNTMTNNIVTYAPAGGITGYWGGPVGSGNVANNNCVYQAAISLNGFSASGNITATADPFNNRASHDYSVKAGSVCAGKGI